MFEVKGHRVAGREEVTGVVIGRIGLRSFLAKTILVGAGFVDFG